MQVPRKRCWTLTTPLLGVKPIEMQESQPLVSERPVIQQEAKAELRDLQELEALGAFQDFPAELAPKAPTAVVIGPLELRAPEPPAGVRGMEAAWGDAFHGPLYMNYGEKTSCGSD